MTVYFNPIQASKRMEKFENQMNGSEPIIVYSLKINAR